ncbi:glycosyltransferase family 2 protein [Paenibacillus elgii]|uniref:glycosyltransferase family 2 protein n=1 Tax=Paenibacillus elgii TaxID=189691 RepID=UPI0013D4B274|nr:glycosyltransferase family 2 protein [Paenibacillus elgii]
MNIVIPMAGRGKRFREAGFTVPKMLIEAAGRPMLYWALDSLKPHVNLDSAIFVCLAEDAVSHPLRRTVLDYSPSARIIELERTTGGQALTVLEAKPFLNPDRPLLIYNCDTYMRMNPSVRFERTAGIDGIIPVFRSQAPELSYVQVDEAGIVTAVREKEVISPYATAGMYHFAETRHFVEAAEEALERKQTVNGEYYVAPLYHELVRKGHRFRIEPAEACYPIGTPEQLQAFERSVYELTREGERQNDEYFFRA